MEDLDDVMRIERTSFPVAWEYTIFLNICFQDGEVVIDESRILLMDVIEQNSHVIGYAVWEIDTRKAEGHILNLAVAVNERRKGNGSRILAHVIDHQKTNQIRRCYLEVRESNEPARKLYESYGFSATKKIPRYYFDEDALVYSLNL